MVSAALIKKSQELYKISIYAFLRKSNPFTSEKKTLSPQKKSALHLRKKDVSFQKKKTPHLIKDEGSKAQDK